MDITQLSLRQKVGQMFICGFHGLEPSQEIKTLLEDYDLGGIIYFRRNIDHFEQVHQLSSSLQEIASKKSGVPLFISIDQEGGMVARLDEGITLMPGNMALGATRDPHLAYQAAYISATELGYVGINMNFAPCLDINNNPMNPVIGVRSFGEDPELVSEMGLAAIRGYQDAGMVSTIKHFPGHGDTNTDSHLELPRISHDKERLYRLELVPFLRAIEQGVDAIMTAHVVFPAFEPQEIPATISRHVITGLLRQQLNYDGVIVTDCLEMNAISKGIGIAEGAVSAIEAGADLVMISHEIDRQMMGIEAVIRAVETGRISEERIDESVQRILRLKQKRILNTPKKDYDKIKNEIGSKASWAVAQNISEQSITLVKDEGQLPIDPAEKTLVIWSEVRVGTEVDEVIDQEETLGAILAQEMPEVHEVRIGVIPEQEEIEHVLQQSQNYKQMIFVGYNASFSEGQQYIVQQLASRTDLRLIVIAARNPFDLLVYPEIRTYLVTYENRPLAMRSLAKVLLGENKAKGKLPVTLTDKFRYGWCSQ